MGQRRQSQPRIGAIPGETAVSDWKQAILSTVVEQLPKLLEKHGPSNVGAAIDELKQAYLDERTAEMQDRRPEIAANQAETDARLAEREAEAKKV